MSISIVLSKIADGQPLDETEKETLSKFDFDAHSAGIRREAERKASEAQKAATEAQKQAEETLAKLSEMESKLTEKESEKLSESEKMAGEIQTLKGSIESEKFARLEAEKLAAETERLAKVDGLKSTNGISFIAGVNTDLTGQAWRNAFSEVDLSISEDVASAVEVFKTENSGLIASPGKGGTGNESASLGKTDESDILKMNDAEAEQAVMATMRK